MQKVIAVIAVVVVLAVGGILLTTKPKNEQSSQQPTQQSETRGATPSQKSASATITYTSSGFDPASVTAKSGDTVVVENKSPNPLQLDSDPHPAHTDDTDLNVGQVAPGKSVTFTVTKTGTFGFHNHLNPSDRGSITVQ